MTFEDKTEVVISQLRADRDRLQNAFDNIRAEIDEQYKWLMQTKHTLYDIDIAFSGIKSFIDKHIGGTE